MAWPTKKLADLLETCDAGVWGKPAVRGKGLFVLRSTNMTNDGKLDFSDVAERNIRSDINKLKLLDGDILVEKSGGGPDQPVGRVAYFVTPDDQSYSFANFIQRLRTKPNLIDGRFLFYRLLFLHKIGFTKKLQSQTTGIRNLKLSLYLKTEIPVPSLNLQKQIVERLDKIAEAQKLNDELIQKADELFQSLLHKELKLAGKGWEVKKLREVCEELFAGGDVPRNNFSKTKTEKYFIPIFANGVEGKDLYGYTDIKKVTKPSITISARGTIGYPAIRTEAFYPIVRLIVLVPNSKIIDLYFLYYSIYNFSFFKTGTSIPQLTIPMVERVKISLPPLETQKQIVAKLSAAQEYKTQLLAQKSKLKELFDSVLAKSFSDKL